MSENGNNRIAENGQAPSSSQHPTSEKSVDKTKNGPLRSVVSHVSKSRHGAPSFVTGQTCSTCPPRHPNILHPRSLLIKRKTAHRGLWFPMSQNRDMGHPALLDRKR